MSNQINHQNCKKKIENEERGGSLRGEEFMQRYQLMEVGKKDNVEKKVKKKITKN